MNFENFNLEKIRNELIRIEDTLIFGFIERSQFLLNAVIYDEQAFGELPTSFLNFILHEIECSHSKARRYSSPDEHPFTSSYIVNRFARANHKTNEFPQSFGSNLHQFQFKNHGYLQTSNRQDGMQGWK